MSDSLGSWEDWTEENNADITPKGGPGGKGGGRPPLWALRKELRNRAWFTPDDGVVPIIIHRLEDPRCHAKVDVGDEVFETEHFMEMCSVLGPKPAKGPMPFVISNSHNGARKMPCLQLTRWVKWKKDNPGKDVKKNPWYAGKSFMAHVTVLRDYHIIKRKVGDRVYENWELCQHDGGKVNSCPHCNNDALSDEERDTVFGRDICLQFYTSQVRALLRELNSQLEKCYNPDCANGQLMVNGHKCPECGGELDFPESMRRDAHLYETDCPHCQKAVFPEAVLECYKPGFKGAKTPGCDNPIIIDPFSAVIELEWVRESRGGRSSKKMEVRRLHPLRAMEEGEVYDPSVHIPRLTGVDFARREFIDMYELWGQMSLRDQAKELGYKTGEEKDWGTLDAPYDLAKAQEALDRIQAQMKKDAEDAYYGEDEEETTDTEPYDDKGSDDFSDDPVPF